MNYRLVLAVFGTMTWAGCSSNSTGAIDATLLDEYRAAIPSVELVSAPTPGSLRQQALGENATYPDVSRDAVVGINGAVQGLIEVLKKVTNTQPTTSKDNEFLWGPFEDENAGFGFVAIYIRDVGPGEDFRYHYAFLRSMDRDIASFTPVIWGGTKPDSDTEPDENGDQYGSGVMLWDFSANDTYEKQHNPNYDASESMQGRFVAVFSREADGAELGGELAVIYAHLAGFVDKGETHPVDADYLYGHWVEPGLTVDFLDFEFSLDVNEGEVNEDVGIRMAFVNEGAGRAEANAFDSVKDINYTVVECWGTDLKQIYSMTAPDGETLGDQADCVAPFNENTLSQAGVPAIEDVPEGLRAQLSCLAETGAPCEETSL